MGYIFWLQAVTAVALLIAIGGVGVGVYFYRLAILQSLQEREDRESARRRDEAWEAEAVRKAEREAEAEGEGEGEDAEEKEVYRESVKSSLVGQVHPQEMLRRAIQQAMDEPGVDVSVKYNDEGVSYISGVGPGLGVVMVDDAGSPQVREIRPETSTANQDTLTRCKRHVMGRGEARERILLFRAYVQKINEKAAQLENVFRACYGEEVVESVRRGAFDRTNPEHWKKALGALPHFHVPEMDSEKTV